MCVEERRKFVWSVKKEGDEHDLGNGKRRITEREEKRRERERRKEGKTTGKESQRRKGKERKD